MTNNSRQTELIKEELAATDGNISAVARALGVDYFALKERFGSPKSPDYVPPWTPEPEDIRTLGRPNFERFVIAAKRAGAPWPDKYDAVIADARRKFDAGTHEMFQTSDRGWVVQYLIPYLVPVERRRFFSDMVVMR